MSIGSGGAIGTYLLLNSSLREEYPWQAVMKNNEKSQGYCGRFEKEKIASKILCSTAWTKKIIKEKSNDSGVWVRVQNNGKNKKISDNWHIEIENNRMKCEIKNTDKKGRWTELHCKPNGENSPKRK